MMAVLVSYLLALPATIATVAWALRGGRQAPERAVVGHMLIFLFWWGAVALVWGALR
jgi:threonine/homoserine/homoserine lactone efflux protein